MFGNYKKVFSSFLKLYQMSCEMTGSGEDTCIEYDDYVTKTRGELASKIGELQDILQGPTYLGIPEVKPNGDIEYSFDDDQGFNGLKSDINTLGFHYKCFF